MKQSQFDERRFRSEVFREYRFLRNLEKHVVDPDKVRKEMGEFHGCLASVFFVLFSKLQRVTADKTYENKKIDKDRGGVREVLQGEKVKSRLCPRLSGFSEADLLPEELEIKVIRVLVEELARKPVDEGPIAERNPSFFAQMAMEIIDQGIGEYCASASF